MSDALEYSNKLGRWSFAYQSVTGVLSSVVSLFTLQGLEPWDSQLWTVHLNHFRFSGPAGFALNPNISPDNQTFSENDFKLVVAYGVDGMEENVEVDWPAQGGTFGLHAGSFRVGVRSVNQVNAPAPLLSGFVVPATGAQKNPHVLPCFTTGFLVVAPLALAAFARPPRAIAYRYWPLGGVLGGPVFLSQTSQTIANVVKFDGQMDVQTANNRFYDPQNAAAWIPLHPRAQFVQVSNTGAVNDANFTLSFLLDLA